jgi:hypothetical protein
MGRDNMKTLPITAWFCPEFTRYGPKQYYGFTWVNFRRLHGLYGVFLASEDKMGKENHLSVEFPKGKKQLLRNGEQREVAAFY